MDHKQIAEKIALPIVCAFAAGVLVALHFVGGENERLRAELKRTTLELKRASLASAECQDADLVAAHYMLARGE